MVLQVADVLLGNFAAPPWVFWVTLMLLVIGLLIVVMFAWVFEMTPEGLKREKDIDRSQPGTAQTRKKLDRLIIGVLVLALGYLVVDKFVLSDQRESAAIEAALEEAISQPESMTPADKSIAVLPFVNMSDNPGNEYFADGLSETLLHMLAQVTELQVAARTSSFAFKGTQTDIREIADKLDVANVLEGSVQRSGNQVRITAQLIQAADGYHLWSQTFDRDLHNIFAVQDEIAGQVVKALTGSLLASGDGQERGGATQDTSAYDLYLQGREAFHANTEREANRASRLMRRAIAMDPDFALAWAGLAEALRRYAVLSGLSWDEYRDEYRAAAEKAADLSPDDSQVITTLGQMHYHFNDYGLAQEIFERAISRDPSNATAWSYLADVYFAQSRYRDAADAAEKAMSIDPLDFCLKGMSSYKFQMLGQIDKAMTLAQAVLENDPQSTDGLTALGNIYWRTGQYAEAHRVYDRLLAANPDALFVKSRLAIIFTDLGDWETAGHILRNIEASNPMFNYSWWNGDISSWLCYLRNDMECVRSVLQQRITRSESEPDRLGFQLQLARFEEDWDTALTIALALIEHARGSRAQEAGVSWWAAMAAGQVGRLELRNELIGVVMDYYTADQVQSTESQYRFFVKSYMHALRGDKANAVEELPAAIDRGFRDLPAIVHLGFFDAILEEPEVQAILEQLRASNELELERLRAVVEELGPAW